MKIRESQLKKIIHEEVRNLLNEQGMEEEPLPSVDPLHSGFTDEIIAPQYRDPRFYAGEEGQFRRGREEQDALRAEFGTPSVVPAESHTSPHTGEEFDYQVDAGPNRDMLRHGWDRGLGWNQDFGWVPLGGRGEDGEPILRSDRPPTPGVEPPSPEERLETMAWIDEDPENRHPGYTLDDGTTISWAERQAQRGRGRSSSRRSSSRRSSRRGSQERDPAPEPPASEPTPVAQPLQVADPMGPAGERIAAALGAGTAADDEAYAATQAAADRPDSPAPAPQPMYVQTSPGVFQVNREAPPVSDEVSPEVRALGPHSTVQVSSGGQLLDTSVPPEEVETPEVEQPVTSEPAPSQPARVGFMDRDEREMFTRLPNEITQRWLEGDGDNPGLSQADLNFVMQSITSDPDELQRIRDASSDRGYDVSELDAYIESRRIAAAAALENDAVELQTSDQAGRDRDLELVLRTIEGNPDVLWSINQSQPGSAGRRSLPAEMRNWESSYLESLLGQDTEFVEPDPQRRQRRRARGREVRRLSRADSSRLQQRILRDLTRGE